MHLPLDLDVRAKIGQRQRRQLRRGRLRHSGRRGRVVAEHRRRRSVCAAVERWGTLKEPKPPMCTDRSANFSHSVRRTDKSKWHKIAIGDLRAILGIEASTRHGSVINVEPGVTVKEATQFLLERGLMLECTLEMEDATLGGLALAEPVDRAHSERAARAVFIGQVALSREAQVRSDRGTGADSAAVDALHAATTSSRGALLADKALRTIRRLVAGRAAEGPLRSIGHTGG